LKNLLENCLKDILNSCKQGFVLDVGGGSVFCKDKNNQERLNQVLWLKHNFNAKVMVLFAKKSVVDQRFYAARNNKTDKFDVIWQEWSEIEKPYWRQCADKFIDTTNLSPEIVLQTIIELQ
jgi:hypothetical protein